MWNPPERAVPGLFRLKMAKNFKFGLGHIMLLERKFDADSITQ
jgi:hypothetical protein